MIMAIFEYRKPIRSKPVRDSLATLRETLEGLKAEPEETPRIADLKRILASRIAEVERKTV
jgi:hypothetical protein